jgi:hypothetical protein
METKVEVSDNVTTTATTDSAEASLNNSVASVELDDEFSEEELKKAEEYKTKGNDAFKSKS